MRPGRRGGGSQKGSRSCPGKGAHKPESFHLIVQNPFSYLEVGSLIVSRLLISEGVKSMSIVSSGLSFMLLMGVRSLGSREGDLCRYFQEVTQFFLLNSSLQSLRSFHYLITCFRAKYGQRLYSLIETRSYLVLSLANLIRKMNQGLEIINDLAQEVVISYSRQDQVSMGGFLPRHRFWRKYRARVISYSIYISLIQLVDLELLVVYYSHLHFYLQALLLGYTLRPVNPYLGFQILSFSQRRLIL